MMMNLYDKLVEVSNKESSYYYKKTRSNPILTPDRSIKFIEEYLKYGSKSKLLDLPFYDKFKSNGKLVHTSSMYFIGILLKDFISESLSEKVNRLVGNATDYPFEYIWFLTSLYHDAAFSEESIQNNDTYRFCTSHLAELKRKYNLENCLLDKNIIDSETELLSPYSIQCYWNYLTFRTNSCNQDHGIVAGLLFYDLLLKNYERAWREHTNFDSNSSEDSYDYFIHDELSWRIEHHELFKYIAFSLMGHNLWKQDDEIISRFNLDDKLSRNDDFKVRINEHPLLFFLGLIDAIEPCKAFSGFKPKAIWQSIDVNLNVKKKIISFRVSNDSIDVDVWFNRIENLKEWMSVEINRLSYYEIQVRIKS